MGHALGQKLADHDHDDVEARDGKFRLVYTLKDPACGQPPDISSSLLEEVGGDVEVL